MYNENVLDDTLPNADAEKMTSPKLQYNAMLKGGFFFLRITADFLLNQWVTNTKVKDYPGSVLVLIPSRMFLAYFFFPRLD